MAKLDRFRQLEGPRRSPVPAAARSNASSRFDALLGPGEKAPAAPEPPPVTESAPPPPAREDEGRDSGQTQSDAEREAWEAAVIAEINRRGPMHAGQQITLWRALMKRGSQEIDESCRPRITASKGIALGGGLFFLGSLLVTGPHAWHLLVLVGAGLFVARHYLK